MTRNWAKWPIYSHECQQDVAALLKKGGSLSAYKANPTHGFAPTEGSWAWKAERLAEKVHDVRHVILCANGTVALTALIRARLGPPQDGVDEIITSPLTFSATPASIMVAGYTPVFADVNSYGAISHRGVERLLGPRIRAILPVDIFGHSAMVAFEHPLVGDSCQAVGVRPWWDHGVWSFNGRKNVPAGEGGAVYTKDAGVAERVRLEIGHGENFGGGPTTNGHVNEVTACLIYHGLLAVKERNRTRQRLARKLNEIVGQSALVFHVPQTQEHALYVYPLVLMGHMEQVADVLTKQGVECQRGYLQPPLHQYPAFAECRRDDLTIAEALSRDQLLIFPHVTPTATEREMEVLGRAIVKACDSV